MIRFTVWEPTEDELLIVADRMARGIAFTESGCVEWRKGISGGYGQIKISGKYYRANRIACHLTHGPAPVGKPYACHTCDNGLCVYGPHLYWGTQSENMQDRVKRGHWRGGRRRKRECFGHEFTPRANGSCKHCRRNYGLS